MSITTSHEEREHAKATVTAETTQQLRADLEYWSVAKFDHAKAWRELTEQRFRVGELHEEALAWVELIAEELHSRRHEGLL